MDRLETKKKEIELLKSKFKEHPEFFASHSYTEDNDFLKNFGIFIPGKEKCPKAYLKLYPSDFIVEEIDNNGNVLTIQYPASSIIPSKDQMNPNHRALFATLVKCNMSTIEVIEEMARTIGCSPLNIRYAGLKDKNAMTAQAISFHDIPFEKLSLLSSPHYFLKDFYFGKGSIEKGGLKGNRFSLFIRTSKEVDQGSFVERQEKISKEGFYNFYYLQRFGTPRLMNYKWGFAILQGRYKEAVTHYLSGASDYEIVFFQNLRKEIKSAIPNWPVVKKIIEPYPIILFYENKIVDYLTEKPEDFIGALQIVQEQTMLWVYGFASLLFNMRLSACITKEQKIPAMLPLLLSNMPADVDSYKETLESVKCYPPPFYNLRPFPTIRLQHRMISCKEKVDIDCQAFFSEGVAIRFKLQKGQYATTFLSHLFNFISGDFPKNLANDLKDTGFLLGDEKSTLVLDYFNKVNSSRKDFSFEESE